ncbi:MAG TPA: DUF4177 domain-containing protein [Thermoanaerobaculia bacterium]
MTEILGLQWPGTLRTARRGNGVMVQQWEYKIINIRSENYRLDPNAATELNKLGADGWELVGLTSVNFKTGATDNIAMVFKRPRRDVAPG